MKKTFALLALAAFVAVPAYAASDPAKPAQSTVPVKQGKMLYSTGGKPIAAVYKITADGSPQVIIDGKLITVPANTLSLDGDKATTTLSKKDLRSLR